MENWSVGMKSLNSEQSLSLQPWALYRLRFVFSAEACSAWELFGGAIAQIDNIGVAINLSVSENVGTAMKYYDLFTSNLNLLREVGLLT